jgi:hypothetical protein
MRSTTDGRPPSSPVPRSPSRPSGTPWGGRDARSDARASEEIRENRKPRPDGSRVIRKVQPRQKSNSAKLVPTGAGPDVERPEPP